MKHSAPIWIVGLAWFVLGVVAGPQPGLAQDTYVLDEQGWVKTDAPEPGSPEAQLQAIRRALAEDRPGDAKSLASEWIENYPNHPMIAEAYLLRGDAKVAQANYYRALFDYEFLIRRYPGTEQFVTALEREYEIARRYTGVDGPLLKRKLLGMRILTARAEGEELLIRIQERVPGSDLGEQASMTLADAYFQNAEMSNAAVAYDLFLENYPRSPRRERAMLRLIQSSLARFKGPNFDATGLIEANQRLKEYEQEFPVAAERLGAAALRVRIEETMARKDLLDARWYERTGDDVAARYIYRRLIKDRPQTAAAADAMRRLEALGVPIDPNYDPDEDAAAGANVESPTTQPAEEAVEDTVDADETVAPDANDDEPVVEEPEAGE